MISLEWAKDYIDISDQDLHELAVKITKAGINIEKVISNQIPNVVIGKVIDCIPHPDSDHMHVCQVEVAEGKIEQIVCGAPNVRKDLKVIVALPGAKLPGDIEIKKSKLRGVESNGMICALCELGLEEATEENYKKGIEELPNDAPIGKDPITYLNLATTLYELDIHKHRNNDCYYHIGFAYEIGAILNRRVTLPEISHEEIEESVKDNLNLKIETKKCPFYLARMVRDVEIKDSPDFIKRRLLDAGMRPINNVVDISNYVMLEFGQPLHFFDKDKLGNNIVVRDANENEKMTTLDNKERILSTKDIVITDGNKPVCIAGVMGGLDTEVTTTTKNILIEAAIFDSVSIRYTARNLDLRSEASIRYGKGLSWEYTEKAMERACYLLEKYAGAKILKDIVRYDVVDKKPKIVKFKPSDVNNLLGITISEEDMKIELGRLEFPYEIENGEFVVTIPNRRLDIDPNVNDIAEEIVRLYGYENLVGTLPNIATKQGEYKGDVKYRKMVSKRLRALGLNETKTYTLVSKEMADIYDNGRKKIYLPNPMSSDKSVIRTTLIPSLLNVYRYNKKRKVKDVALYEIAKTYNVAYEEISLITGLVTGNYVSNGWQQPVKYDFYILKGIIENLLNFMGFKNRYKFIVSNASVLHPGISADILLDNKKIGIIGRIHPSIEKDEIYMFELSLNALMTDIKPIKYKEAPKYPSIEKDMAFVVKKNITAGEMIETIKKTGGRLLTNVNVFDVYTGENVKEDEKSLAFNLVFREETRTLTEEEVMEIFNKIITKVSEKFNAELRDK